MLQNYLARSHKYIKYRDSVMKKRTKSLLEEINNMVHDRDKHLIIESKADHIIASAINLVQLINESYEGEEAADLTKRLYNSIKTHDPRKFKRGIFRIKNENK